MKHKFHVSLAALCFLLTLLSLGAVPASAAIPSSAETARTTANLRMHRTMDTNKSSTILVIPKNKVVMIRSRENDDWFFVFYNGKSGYVKGSYLTKNTDVMKTTAALRMRMNPDTKATTGVVLVMPKGSTVEIMDRLDSTWAWVAFNGRFGWASLRYMARENATTNVVKVTTTALRLRSSMSTYGSYNIILVIPKGNQVELISEQNNGWVKVRYEGKTGYVKGSYLKNGKQTASDDGVVKVMAGDVNVRSSKSTASSRNIIGMVRKGSSVTILSQDGSWCKINYKGKTAYIRNGYFTNQTGRG